MALKPRRLERGDVVGVFSPSSEIASFPRRFSRGLDALTALGFVPRIAANTLATSGQNAGSPSQRADDFRALLDDDDVKAIICTSGGWSTNGMLPLIDFDQVRRRPKIICGFSDVTALLVAVYTQTGLVTFHGPTLLASFADSGGPLAYTVDRWLDIVSKGVQPLDLSAPQLTTDELLLWEKEDDRPRTMRPASKWISANDGVAEGVLVGGNLTTLCRLIGTPSFPSLDGAILFLEDSCGSIAQLESQLNHLAQIGSLSKINGLLFGRPSRFVEHPARGLGDVLGEFGRRFRIPVLRDIDFGHTEPRLTFPIGVQALVDAGSASITILESAVA